MPLAAAPFDGRVTCVGLIASDARRSMARGLSTGQGHWTAADEH